MTARRRAKAQLWVPPARVADGVPACLKIRACIEVWSVPGTAAPEFSARRRYRLVRRWWLATNGVTDTKRQCELVPSAGAPWSVDRVVGRPGEEFVRTRLHRAGLTVADLPGLRRDAEALLDHAEVTRGQEGKPAGRP